MPTTKQVFQAKYENKGKKGKKSKIVIAKIIYKKLKYEK